MSRVVYSSSRRYRFIPRWPVHLSAAFFAPPTRGTQKIKSHLLSERYICTLVTSFLVPGIDALFAFFLQGMGLSMNPAVRALTRIRESLDSTPAGSSLSRRITWPSEASGTGLLDRSAVSPAGLQARTPEQGTLEQGTLEQLSGARGGVSLEQVRRAADWRRGAIVEWLGAGDGSGAGWLALAVAWRMCIGDRILVVLDCDDGRDRHFYPPAAQALGVDVSRMVVLRPRNAQDAVWGMDQVLRCRRVGGVWGRWDRLDSRVFRRLQLAAEEGEALGMVVRPGGRRDEPSWAHLRLLVTGLCMAGSGESMSERRWRVEVLRRR